jgi:hypothetical protein
VDGLIKGVKDNEPDCELFQAHREIKPQSGGGGDFDGEEVCIVIPLHATSTWANGFVAKQIQGQRSRDLPSKESSFLAFGEALTTHDLLVKPLPIKIFEPVKGFVRE